MLANRNPGDRRFAILVMALCAVLAIVVLPLSYSPFSWEAFGQLYGIGESCTSSTECSSGFCVDGFCCDTACDGDFVDCDIPGRVGICTAVTTAPALSPAAYVIAVFALLLGALLGWRRRSVQ